MGLLRSLELILRGGAELKTGADGMEDSAVCEPLAATALSEGPRAVLSSDCSRIGTASPNPLPIRAGCVIYGL
jgi:hypothetical protein